MILNVRNLHSYYGKSHILQGVDLELAPGRMTCLLGRNGEGKSTLLHLLAERRRKIDDAENNHGTDQTPPGTHLFQG